MPSFAAHLAIDSLAAFWRYTLGATLAALVVTAVIYGLALVMGLNPLVTVHVLNFLVMAFSHLLVLWLYRLRYPSDEHMLRNNLLFGASSWLAYIGVLAGIIFLALTLQPAWLAQTQQAGQAMLQQSKAIVVEKASEEFFISELQRMGSLSAGDIAYDACKRLVIWMVLVVPLVSLLVSLMTRPRQNVTTV